MKYTVTVATGNQWFAGTREYVYLTLVGEEAESEKITLDPYLPLERGEVKDYTVHSASNLGRVILVRLEMKTAVFSIRPDHWYCSYVKVTAEGEETAQTFPCYRWMVGDCVTEIAEGTAKKPCDSFPLEKTYREKELKDRQSKYRWMVYDPEFPKCIDAKSPEDLPWDVRFDTAKSWDFNSSLYKAIAELYEKEKICRYSLNKPDDFKKIIWDASEKPAIQYLMEHWHEDDFFAYQFLNGANPRMIHKCNELPLNFLVTEEMVQTFLHPSTTLEKEMKGGRMYLVDYALLDGVPANVIKEEKQYIAAPLCLLYDHPDRRLIPIAIQLVQKPQKDTPVFSPNDSLAWSLAKMWVRNADFQIMEILSHLLRTHLLAEVFCVATLRQLPAIHPIYKLLIPHLQFSLEINIDARTGLISPDGIFKQAVSTGGKGLGVLGGRACTHTLTFSSLQPHLDFKQRDVSELREYHYRDDSLKLWDAIEKFVTNMVSLYYGDDSDVVADTELQAWIKDMVEEGFKNLPEFDLDNEIKSKKDLITVLSVVIYTCSAQHAAINNAQYDFCAMVPNMPCTMRKPPPKDKASVTPQFIMDTLPNLDQSCTEVAITWALGSAEKDRIPLAQYKEKYFTESKAQKEINNFQQDLKKIEAEIKQRNNGLVIPYPYLLPAEIDNSIAT